MSGRFDILEKIILSERIRFKANDGDNYAKVDYKQAENKYLVWKLGNTFPNFPPAVVKVLVYGI